MYPLHLHISYLDYANTMFYLTCNSATHWDTKFKVYSIHIIGRSLCSCIYLLDNLFIWVSLLIKQHWVILTGKTGKVYTSTRLKRDVCFLEFSVFLNKSKQNLKSHIFLTFMYMKRVIWLFIELINIFWFYSTHSKLTTTDKYKYGPFSHASHVD